MTETTIIRTDISLDVDDFDIRREFCGVHDKRLNELRQFTNCIIDLQIHPTKHPFEKVTWIISHYDEAVRAFTVKRIQTWAQMTQIAIQMHIEDITFHQQLSSDTSSSSTDGRVQQLGNSIKSSPSPQKGSSLKMFNKHSKTPLHDHYYGSVPNAALVPQTDIQSRYQHRRRRNSSSSSSGVQRPALFGKPSDYFLSRGNEYPRRRHSPLSTPISKIKPNESSNTTEPFLSKPSYLPNEREQSYELNKNLITEYELLTNGDDIDYEEEAKWENLLSDTSDFENDSHPLMADIIVISQLRDSLMHSQISSTDDIAHIQLSLPKTLIITSDEKLKTLKSQPVWFHRLYLNSKIILADGIHKSRQQAEKFAYKKMIDLMTNKQGVQVKVLVNGQCKAVLQKAPPPKQFNNTIINESLMNTTTDVY
ncbi:unnamed protein product [Adineta ricciae]|uniref:Uncharacterized protein n=1 Tax=Adineta ricciae TaxID=249248 RepID=A0A814EHU8_ADIRI|nr:unnamed protein product [Adineta ricciae]